ncbi:MAG TPA: sugar transferase [Patescibacteria group bacterium]|nr:sugar transferase [Patescibacteria group bacterium]
MPYRTIKKSIFYEISKRTIDIILSVILLVLFSPIILVIAILIKLDSPGTVFAKTPPRVGKKGKLFHMYKFRSMIQNAHELLRTNPEFKKLYDQYKLGSYKLENDPRVTRIGGFIRKHSLDEVPQFINVFNGDMSVVGPRAYYADELQEQQKKYPDTIEAVKVVLSIRPGITGQWQVSGRSKVNFDKRIKMDAEYVEKCSLLNDFIIILKTPWAMISGRDAL